MNRYTVIMAILEYQKSPVKKNKEFLDKIVEKLKSGEIDIIVWNDTTIPIPKTGQYLLSDKTITKDMYLEIDKYEIVYRNMPKAFDMNTVVKWATMPKYKPKYP